MQSMSIVAPKRQSRGMKSRRAPNSSIDSRYRRHPLGAIGTMQNSWQRNEDVDEATPHDQLSYLSGHVERLSLKIDELVKLRNALRRAVRTVFRIAGHSTEFKNRKGTFTPAGLARLDSLFESGAKTADIARFFDMSYTAIYHRRLRWNATRRLDRGN
jgi:hypothetical protein